MKQSLLFFLMLFFLAVSVTAYGQHRVVSGTVYDSGNKGLPGATVVIKGTTNGTVTDIDGRYSIDGASSNSTLVFSFIGMKTVEIAVGDKSVINVTLEEESIGLEEVVAIRNNEEKRPYWFCC
jgi:hypothetical protein